MSQNKPTEVECARYAEHYVKHGNKSEAWRNAFPESKAQAHTVWRRASLFHKISDVQAKVTEYQQLTSEALKEEFNISASDIRKMLVGAATAGLRQINSKPVSIQGSVSALTELNRMNGNHAPTKIGGDISAPVPIMNMTSDEYRKLRKQIINEDDC